MLYELSPRQLFELHMLEDDVNATLAAHDTDAWIAAQAALCRYIHAEGIQAAQFNGHRNGGTDFIHAFGWACIVKHAPDYTEGCTGYEVLKAAGLLHLITKTERGG